MYTNMKPYKKLFLNTYTPIASSVYNNAVSHTLQKNHNAD